MTLECEIDSCSNQALWHPVLLICFKGINLNPIRALIPIHVCDDHRKMLTVNGVLSDKGWNDICTEIYKIVRTRPKRNLTELDFAPIGGQESRDAMAKLHSSEKQGDKSNVLRSG